MIINEAANPPRDVLFKVFFSKKITRNGDYKGT